MTVTRNTIIAEILQNDPSQGCVPIFLNTGMHCLGCICLLYTSDAADE